MNEIEAMTAPGGSPAPQQPNLANHEIYARIFQAIVDHRLMPGTHLKEDILCDVYGIGRTRVRVVLSRLAADHIVDLVANRGAFVCRPTIEEAREVFRARRQIEGHLIRRAVENLDDKIRDALRNHLREEQVARDAGDQSVVIKSCGDFHQVLADQARSPIMSRFLRELIARSSLIVAIYERRPLDECEMDEHQSLTDLVLAGRADEAVELMERHLTGIEDRLDLRPREESGDNLRGALSAIL
jgi:DNA-binding GntR family transcriptional regulator